MERINPPPKNIASGNIGAGAIKLTLLVLTPMARSELLVGFLNDPNTVINLSMMRNLVIKPLAIS